MTEKGAPEAIERACEEARITLDQQVNWILQIDDKAVRILRANILLFGLVLTALSISVRTGLINVGQYFNFYNYTAVISLLMSTIGAAMTYIASSFRRGLSSTDSQRVIEEAMDEEEFMIHLREGYTDWIDYNDRVIAYNAKLITLTILAGIDALIFFTAGVLVGGIEAKGTEISYIVFVFLILFVIIVDIMMIYSQDIVMMLNDTEE